MDKKPSVVISSTPFPNQMATDAEKASKDYGLKVGKSIEGEWFRRVNSGNCRYYDQYLEFHKLRLYGRGEQPTEMYKKLLAVDGDLSYLNLDWKPVSIIPKFVDIVVNGMADRLYSIKAESQDVMSAEKKNVFQDMVESDMLAKNILEKTKQEFGIDAYNVPPDEIPENDEELALYMQLKYKPSIEIAEEIAINTLLDMNDYKDVVKPQVDRDLTEIGIGAVKHSFYPGAGVKIEYVDPAALVYSYTEKPDFSDVYYIGEVKQVHYTELRKMNPELTDEELTDIKNSGSAWYNYWPVIRTFQEDVFNNEMVTLLYFNYKTEKRFVYKKKKLENGGERVIKRDENFKPTPDNPSFERLDVVKDVWYEGVLVLGSNILIKWDLLKNMVRPEAATQKALCNYIINSPSMYKGQIQSLVKRMIPFADQIQLTHLKLQQVMSRVVPDGVFIDADGISEVDLGTGAAYNPEDALKMYFQTGSVVGRSYTGDGEFNNARVPIQELQTNSGASKMSALINHYNYNLNMIRDVTGLNEARDGSSPDPNALVGVQKLAALNSNVATRHILQGGLMVTKRLAEGISLRVADILNYADFREEFAMQVGKYNLSILDDIKNLYLHSFGIFIELAPDEEEKQQVEQNIQIALSRDQIDLEDAIDIRMIKNLKLANELLKVKRKRKTLERQKREDMQSQIQMQINMQSQEAAAQQKQQTAQMEAQAKIAIKQNEAQLDMQRMQFEVEKKKELMALEFEYNMQLKGIETDGLMKREKEREKAKDKRVDLQATRQSELINQRKNNLPPLSFESEEDSLDNFDLGSFEPR
jgi:hypothetical protein